MKIFKNKLLLFIILLAASLRFYQLGAHPVSLTWDEVAWGYNGYSLGIDGKDEFGRLLPHDYFESFGDFKPPVYAYLTVISIKLFGLNEFGVRFPSAIFGTLTVLLTYFLTKRIFSENSKFEIRHLKLEISLLSAGLLAISPWHINLSRAAFEANVATFFLVSGVFFFLESLYGKKWFIIVSAVSFVLSMYTFNTSRIVAPLLVLGLTIGFGKKLWEQKKHLFFAVLVGILLLLPTLNFLLSPQASLRFKEVNIFSDLSVIERTNQEISYDNNALWSRIIHHRYLTFGVEYLKHYFDHFNPIFLFTKGDVNPKFSTQDVGTLYLLEAPFLIAGILLLFKKRKRHWWLIPFWILVGIVPAATARETPHALRIETTIPTFQILTAYGLFYFLSAVSSIKNKVLSINIKYFIFTTYILILIFTFSYYLYGYYTYYPREYGEEWQEGYKESIDFVKQKEHEFDKVIITEELGRPYIYYLFYTKTHPQEFRNTAKIERDAFGFVQVHSFGKYEFTRNMKPNPFSTERILYIGKPSDFPKNAIELKRFYLLNGKHKLTAFTL